MGGVDLYDLCLSPLGSQGVPAYVVVGVGNALGTLGTVGHPGSVGEHRRHKVGPVNA